MLESFCSVCGKKKSRFIKNQEASGLLGKLVIKTLLRNIPNHYSKRNKVVKNCFSTLSFNLCPNYIYDHCDLFIALVESFLKEDLKIQIGNIWKQTK